MTASGGGEDTSESDIVGSLARAKACAVRAAYESADLDDFDHLGFAELPAAVRNRVEPGDPGTSYAEFAVPGVGQVYVVEVGAGVRQTSFYDVAGGFLAALRTSGSLLEWQLQASTPSFGADASAIRQPLVCTSGPTFDASRRETSAPRPDASRPDGSAVIRDAAAPPPSIRDAARD